MKCQIEQAVTDIGVKVIFGSVDGISVTDRVPEWEKERKVRIERLIEKYADFSAHEDAIMEGYHILHDRAGVKRRKNIPSSENLTNKNAFEAP